MEHIANIANVGIEEVKNALAPVTPRRGHFVFKDIHSHPVSPRYRPSPSNVGPTLELKPPDVVSLPIQDIQPEGDGWYTKMRGIVVKNISYALMGIVLGTLVDKTISATMSKNPKNQNASAWKRIVVQLSVNVAIVVCAELFFPTIADEWINTNAGMFFPAFFFSSQVRLFRDLAEFEYGEVWQSQMSGSA